MLRKCYGKVAPRGFSNEIQVHVFASRKERDQWLREDREELVERMRRTCSATEARRILAAKGNDLTEVFHSRVDHGC